MTADGGLDLLWRVRARGHAPLPSGQQDHAAGLANGECGADIGSEVELLDRNRVRGVRVEQPAHARVDVGEPALQSHARGSLDHAIG